MRHVVAGGFALMVLAGVVLGVQSLLGSIDDPLTAQDPRAVATAWAAAASDGDVATLTDLAAGRTDLDELAVAHEGLWGTLGGPVPVVVDQVDDAGDGTATATLAHVADLGAAGTWSWTSELPLQRVRGEWSAAWGPDALHPELDAGWTVQLRRDGPVRAPLLDRLGRTLSGSTELVTIGVQPSRLPDESRLVSTIAGVLPEALTPLQQLLDRDDLEPDWFYPLVTVDVVRADEAWPDLLGLPGVLRRSDGDGVGTAAFAPEVLGSVELTDDGPVGASGLQRLLDDRLTGSELVEVLLLDPDGRERAVLHSAQADPAPPLVTTLDRDVQRAVDDALLTTSDPVGVAVVDVATGGLVATASRPGTGYARALEGRYPPGTVAGIVTLAAALLDGRTADDDLACPEQGTPGGVTVTAGGPTGERTLRGVLRPGCAVGLAELGAALGGAALDDAGAALGVPTDPQLVVDAAGWSAPTPADVAAAASAAVGHARVTTSTVAAAALVGTVARGAPVPVHLLADEAPDAGPGLDAEVATALRLALRTSGADGPVSVAGAELAGMVGRTGLVRGDPAPATGWWVGWVTSGGPEVAIAVTVEGDDGTDAARLAERILRELTA